MRAAAWIGTAVGVVVLVAAGAYVVIRPDRALQAGAGTAAHNLCSETFIAHRPVAETMDELVKPLMGPPSFLVRTSVDPALRTADAWMGVHHAKAVFTPGYGCRLVYDEPAVPLPPAPADAPRAADNFAPDTLVETRDPALRAALDTLFADPPGKPARHVKALVIVKDGHVVAERYAPGFGIATPMLSFSVAKSVTNALAAILVRQKRLDMFAAAPVPEWRAQPGDPRAKITPDNLLRMESGLDADEEGTGFDPASQMLYCQNDMAAFAASHPAREPPARTWNYTSCNTLILDRILSRLVGGGPAGMRAFASRELFAPLGMQDVTLEFDGAGTFVGSSHVYAPARSFARLGQLYLDDGVAPDGRRILPEGWVAYSRRSTLGAPYGSGFWTLDGPSDDARDIAGLGFPKDGFFASGDRGQRIYIIPSRHMIIARFGYTPTQGFGLRQDMALMRVALARLK